MDAVNQTMIEKITNFMKSRGGKGISFVQLQNHVEGFSNADENFMLHYGDTNIVLWFGITDSGTEALLSMLKLGLLKMTPTEPLVYYIDGQSLRMPLAKNIKRKYKNKRWLPVTFNLQ